MQKRILASVLAGILCILALSAAAADAVKPGYLFFFGSFEQDTFDGDGREPIVWRVLDTDPERGLVLALSEYGLYTMKYHRNNNQTYWGDTDVRDWLNSTFLASFTDAERAMITDTEVSGSYDTAFLLNADQVTRYLKTPYLCYATPWALAHGEEGAYVNEDTGASSWLVRTDVAKKRIAWVGGGGKLYTPDGKKGVNYLTSKDNVVRPAIWVSEEATGRSAEGYTFPLYARTIMKISTRSGPTTGYNGIGDYFSGGGQVVRVLSRVFDGSIWWLEIEFEYKGAMIRCYTGLKRVDVNIKKVPDDPAGHLGTGMVIGDVTAYYGPGTQYKHQVAKYTPEDGTTGDVIKEENGWYCLEYKAGKELVRVWLPPEALSIQ